MLNESSSAQQQQPRCSFPGRFAAAPSDAIRDTFFGPFIQKQNAVYSLSLSLSFFLLSMNPEALCYFTTQPWA